MRVQQTPPTEDEKMVSKDKRFELGFEKKKYMNLPKPKGKRYSRQRNRFSKAKNGKIQERHAYYTS